MSTPMDKLKELLSRCKCGVYVSVNEHRDAYESAEQALAARQQDLADIPDVKATMIATNTIVEIQFYPNTPVGFNLVYHYDLEAALDTALASFSDQPGDEHGI